MNSFKKFIYKYSFTAFLTWSFLVLSPLIFKLIEIDLEDQAIFAYTFLLLNFISLFILCVRGIYYLLDKWKQMDAGSDGVRHGVWNRVFQIVIWTFLGLVSYFTVSVLSLTFLNVFFVFVALHLFLGVLYTFRRGKYLKIALIVFLIYVGIIFIPGSMCSVDTKMGPMFSCDCYGIKKERLFLSQCVGVRKNCLKYRGYEGEKFKRYDLPLQVSCDSLDH